MSSLTEWIKKETSSEMEYIGNESAIDQRAEDAFLPEDERSDIEEKTRIAAEQAMIEAANEAKSDPLGVWLDYVLPAKDERRSADCEPW